MRSAVATARGIVDQSPGAIPFFAACAALAKAIADPALAGSRGAAEEIRAKLNSAQSWHARQNADRKFRLKALAARFFVPPHQHSGVARCPLCRARLSTPEQQALAAELAGLRKDALEAERKLEDVCRALETNLLRRLPEHLRRHWDVLSAMEPGTGYAAAMRERFCEAGQFRRILPGLVESTRIRVREQGGFAAIHIPRIPPYGKRTHLRQGIASRPASLRPNLGAGSVVVRESRCFP